MATPTPTPATADEPAGRPAVPLWTRDFRYYFTARLVSLLGDAMLPVALMYGVVSLGYGASGVGYVLASQMLPLAVFVLFGGVLADRFTPRRMMIGADALRLLVQGCAAASFAVGHPPLWLLMGLAALSGTATAAFQPGVASVVPQVAVDLQRANATLRIAEAIATMGGPTLAALLLAVGDVATVLALDAGTFAVSGLCLLMLRLAPVPRPARKASTWRNLVEGWHEFRSRTWLWAVIVVWVVNGLVAFGPIRPVTTVLVTGAYGAAGLGAVWTAFGAGNVLGGLLGVRLRPARPLAAGATAMLVWALMPLSNALALPLWGRAACFAAGGAAWAFWSVMWATSVQSHVPGEVLNRVYAYDVAGSLIAFPAGQALAGPVSELLGARTAQTASAVVATASFVVLLLVRAVRTLPRADRPRPAAAPAPEPADA
ncbi:MULTISPECIES: MFS transporter [Kitasatospora]|uniref:Putative major facilitator superfamily transporter n=1 Tax=Kitasatospora setae (strain ATCC 33774 / DSM 43861 / JCM 3304 / KCC A-0304 / NBRC 14216 / KM-6054) TaxID=452652 RepID=E4NA50_KITSK|nr:MULTISPECIES: MFS transporter [Kitasatospora]BAJ28081.1 putative major facilitator superfamily transporter [Kitasatospora setae KM-6054]